MYYILAQYTHSVCVILKESEIQRRSNQQKKKKKKKNRRLFVYQPYCLTICSFIHSCRAQNAIRVRDIILAKRGKYIDSIDDTTQCTALFKELSIAVSLCVRVSRS